MKLFNYYAQNSYAAYPEGDVPNQLFLKFLEIGRAYTSFVIKSDDGVVIGFFLLHPYNPFEVFKETAEVSYFIKPEFVGKGIGTSALIKLQDEAKKLGIKHLLADISSENNESIEFHKKNGFNQCGTFHSIGKKFGKIFSVVWMEKEIK